MDPIKEGAILILQGLKQKFGLDLDDENFRETPERISKAYDEIFAGIQNTDDQVREILNKSFPSTYSQMVISSEIRVYSMCPHHMLPVEYTVHAAYIPEKGGNVIGISKISRLVEILAKRPVLQEQFVDDVTSYLMEIEGCSGSACTAIGKHFCMAMRGVKQNDSLTITNSLKGIFLEDSHKGIASRNEFFASLKL